MPSEGNLYTKAWQMHPSIWPYSGQTKKQWKLTKSHERQCTPPRRIPQKHLVHSGPQKHIQRQAQGELKPINRYPEAKKQVPCRIGVWILRIESTKEGSKQTGTMANQEMHFLTPSKTRDPNLISITVLNCKGKGDIGKEPKTRKSKLLLEGR